MSISIDPIDPIAHICATLVVPEDDLWGSA
jgi:hypothetical protein